MSLVAVCLVAVTTTLVSVQGFVPQALVNPALAFQQRSVTTGGPEHVSSASSSSSSSRLHMMEMMDAAVMFDPASVSAASTSVMESASTLMDSASSMFSSSNFMSFTDQGNNLAGIFFQASLLPYLAFLYFLSFRANRIPDQANFGFQFILIFVLSTIPSGIITKSVYGLSLANTDWLHGGCETLLTLANVLIVRTHTNTSTSSNRAHGSHTHSPIHSIP